ncbi:MAG: hypothetical protein Q4F88_03950 [Eubacteriales bacterium]|nr:hypothetical protein [Eubacteriales bacterium]
MINNIKIDTQKIYNAYIIESDNLNYAKEICKNFLKEISFLPNLVDTYNHPDIIYLESEKNTIKVNEVRNQIINDTILRPSIASHKAYIIMDASLLNESSQNALLKTLEEPPNYVIIFLITKNVNNLLDTIKSRAIFYHFFEKEKEIERLQNLYFYNDTIKIVSNGSFNTIKEIIDYASLFKKKKSNDENKDDNNIKDALTIMRILINDTLKYKNLLNTEYIDFRNEEIKIQNMCTRYNDITLGKFLDELTSATKEQLINVDNEMIITKLLFTLREKEV